MKRILCMILAFVLVLGLLPAEAFAAEKNVVYLSISYDGEYIQDTKGRNIAYLPVSLDKVDAIDLAEYGLENMLFDGDGDGEYDTTALQLIIYAHETLYGGNWEDVNFDALPGSSYFKGGVFGFTENLMYFHNGDFPVDESQTSDFMTVGATSDRIVLEAGDFLDIASFECYSFLWDALGGFHFFADSDENFAHDFQAEAGETLSVKLMHSFCDLMFGQSYLYGAADYEVFYGKTYGDAEGSVMTDGDGNAEITIDEAGTYYLWCYGGIGSDDGTHSSCDHFNATQEPCIVSAPAYAVLTVSGASVPPTTEPTEPEPTEPETEPTEPETEPAEPDAPNADRNAQDVSAVLNATMTQLAATVTEPAFGTNAGEWTVFSLARGNHFAKDSKYFADYYDRIVDYVNTTASALDLSGALDKNKSTDNSRLIMALSAIGKNATSVGDWDLVDAYSANGINWIKKQGINGTIWTLIALDTGNYETSDPTIRQQCVESLLSLQHNDGGWSLVTAKAQPSNVDITGMALTALYPYRNEPGVSSACAQAIAWLAESQLATGGFPYGTGETSESCAWAIVALTTWGINPDTDPRFIKNGKSAVDNLLSYYIEEEAMFAHQGTVSNAMATDQACYALVAYDRFVNGKAALYDYSDVVIDDPIVPPEPGDEPDTPTEPEEPEDPTDIKINAALGLPTAIENTPGTEFNAIISLDNWSNEEGFKLVDFLMTVPEGLEVTGVTSAEQVSGGEVSYHLDSDGNLRCVYFDAEESRDLTVSGSQFPVELFNVTFALKDTLTSNRLNFAIEGMSVKRSSDSTDANAMVVVGTAPVTCPDGSTISGSGTVQVVEGISFSAVCLYQGDDVDLIPSDKKAVAVAVTGLEAGVEITYCNSGEKITFLFSEAITAKTGVSSYVALVNSSIPMEHFVNWDYMSVGNAYGESILFGDSNSDTRINAQDALAAVDLWLRKSDAPSDEMILTMNVNGDSRINTFDALGIVEAFVDGSTYGVVTKAANLATRR